jgi:predicted Zn finger-like uncharacterized protein
MTMAISTTCPNCKARFRLDDELAGKKVRCQKCAGIFEVPVFDGSMGSPIAPPASNEPAAQEPAEPAAPATAITIAPPPMAVPAPPPIEKAEDQDRRREDDVAEAPPINKSDTRRPPRLGQHGRAANAGSNSTAIILAIAGLAVFSCLICGGVGIAYIVVNDRPNPPQKDGFAKGRQDGLNKKQIPPVNVQPQPLPPNPVPPPVQGPAVPINVNLGANGRFQHDSQLIQNDPGNMDGKRYKLYTVRLEANRTYQIDMTSLEIDSYLIVLDERNLVVDRDDDSGGNLNARIFFTPKRTAVYQIQATHFQWQGHRPTIGNYTLVVQRLP